MKSGVPLNVATSLLFFGLFLLFGNIFTSESTDQTWQINHYGSLSQFKALSGTTGIGISESSELVTIDLSKQSILSSIDLGTTDSDSYALLDFVLVTYSTASSTFYVYEKYSGIFLEKVKLDSPPLHFGQFFNYGVLVLDSRGILTAWTSELKKEIGKFDVSSFKTAAIDGLVYVSLGLNVLCLDNLGKVISTDVKLNSDIIDLEFGVALTKSEVLKFDAPEAESDSLTSKTIKASLKNPKVLSRNIVGEFESERFTLYEISEGKELKRVTQHAARHAISITPVLDAGKVFVVAQVPNGFEIHDFTKFVSTLEVNDIISYERVSSSEHEDINVFLSPQSDRLAIVSRSSDEVHVFWALASTDDLQTYTYPLKESLPRSKSILIDSPRSISQIEKSHYLAEESHRDSPSLRMLAKMKHHLALLGKVFFSVLKGNLDIATAKEDTYGFQKLLITFDDRTKVLTARNSQSAKIAWQTILKMGDSLIGLESINDAIYLLSPTQVTKVSARSGAVESLEDLPRKAEKLIKLSVDLSEELLEEGFEPYTFVVKSGSTILPTEPGKAISPNQFYLDQDARELTAYKIVDDRITATWSYSLQDETILASSKNQDVLLPASGIATANRAVLYKYLNPNLVTVVTQNKASQITVHLLDGITGAVLHLQKHEDQPIDASTLKLVQNDNWVIYTYVKKDGYQQYVSVLDLFSTVENARGGKKSAFTEFDTEIHNVLSKTFIFPEKIEMLASTRTRFGITVKSIVILTETGSLVEIPKFVFNSRRVDDRALTQEDAKEFKMMPYEPLVGKPDLQVLNKNGNFKTAKGIGSVLIQPTEMELTSVICYIDTFTEFCTVVQPSLSYDILKSGFDKHKLIATIGVLYAAYIATKPMVRSKKLNTKWLD